jgi:KipI family sensor histidine kinase inhibitor
MRQARPAGDAALLVEADGVAARLASAIRARQFEAVLDVIPGARTVLVTTEPGSWDLGELASLILALALPAPVAGGSARAEIPVVYDGPDLAEVARLTGLDPAGVIARHQAAEYTVGWMGFSPGFGYLTGLDSALHGVQRLARPRLSVPAGSVAIAGGLACVYPVTSPGGWRLLGRTSTRIWDPGREPPALLEPGTRVRFRAVADLDATLTPSATSVPSATPDVPDASPRPADRPDSEQRGRFSVDTTENRPRYGEPEAGTGAGAGTGTGPETVIEVIRPGALATIQDLGRTGLGHLGVPRSGAADAASLRLANRLAGNAQDAAGIEITLGRAALRFADAALVAVTGAPAGLTVTGGQGGPPQTAEFGTAFSVGAGSVLRVAAPAAGLRTYLAVRGGIDVPAVLGSRSSDLLSGLGPAPLRAGDLLRVGSVPPAAQSPRTGTPTAPMTAGTAAAAQASAGAAGPASAAPGTVTPGTVTPGTVAPGRGRAGAGGAVRLRVLAGPRDDWFGAGALAVLCGGAAYAVTAASNRTGLRLDGPALQRAREDELPSEGMVAGALQVPPDGMPILLLADHPVTGGYPVIAVVRSADISLAAQLRPGQLIRFTLSQ